MCVETEKMHQNGFKCIIWNSKCKGGVTGENPTENTSHKKGMGHFRVRRIFDTMFISGTPHRTDASGADPPAGSTDGQ